LAFNLYDICFNYFSDEKIPFTKVGRKNMFRKSDLDQYLENQAPKPRTSKEKNKTLMKSPVPDLRHKGINNG